MLKEVLEKYIDAFFKVYEDDLKSLPKLPYDEDNPSNLYVGEMDDDKWIQWQYVPVDRSIDFSGLEEEYAIQISKELKEYYNSFTSWNYVDFGTMYVFLLAKLMIQQMF